MKPLDAESRRRWNRIGLALSCAGSGAIAALAVVAITASSQPLPAFPGWQSIPDFPGSGSVGGPLSADCSGPSMGISRRKLGRMVIQETRGTYAAAVFTASYGVPSDSSVCLVGEGGGAPAAGAGEASFCSSGSLRFAAVGPGRIETHGVLQTCELRGPNGLGLVTFARGRVGAGVTAVTLDHNGTDLVQATVSGGWFLAWWPGNSTAAVASVKGTDTSRRLALLS